MREDEKILESNNIQICWDDNSTNTQLKPNASLGMDFIEKNTDFCSNDDDGHETSTSTHSQNRFPITETLENIELTHASTNISEKQMSVDSTPRNCITENKIYRFPALPPFHCSIEKPKQSTPFPGKPPPLMFSKHKPKKNFPGEPPSECPPYITKIASNISDASKLTEKTLKKKTNSFSFKSLTAHKIDKRCFDLKFAPKPPSGYKAKKLQWELIEKNNISGTIWEVISNNYKVDNEIKLEKSTFCQMEKSQHPLLPDYQKLSALFFEQPGSKLKLTKNNGGSCLNDIELISARSAGTQNMLTVFEGKRRQNIEICLKGLGLLDNINSLIETIAKLESDSTNDTIDKCLSIENLEIVMNLFPTASEEKALKAFEKRIETKELQLQNLGKAERFMLTLLKIEDIRPRIQCALIRSSFFTDFGNLTLKVDRLDRCVSQIIASLKSGSLRILFEYILKVGNYLNYGTKHGDALGFTIDSLLLLKSIKSTDGSITLLKLIAEAFCSSNSKSDNLFWDELKNVLGGCRCIADCSILDILSLLQQFNVKLEKVKQIVEKAKNEKFCKNYTNFIKTAHEHLEKTKQKIEGIQNNLLFLARYLAEKSKTPVECFDILRRFDRFWKELNAAHIAAEKKKRQQIKSRQASSSKSTKEKPPVHNKNIKEEPLSETLTSTSDYKTTQSQVVNEMLQESTEKKKLDSYQENIINTVSPKIIESNQRTICTLPIKNYRQTQVRKNPVPTTASRYIKSYPTTTVLYPTTLSNQFNLIQTSLMDVKTSSNSKTKFNEDYLKNKSKQSIYQSTKLSKSTAMSSSSQTDYVKSLGQSTANMSSKILTQNCSSSNTSRKSSIQSQSNTKQWQKDEQLKDSKIVVREKTVSVDSNSNQYSSESLKHLCTMVNPNSFVKNDRKDSLTSLQKFNTFTNHVNDESREVANKLPSLMRYEISCAKPSLTSRNSIQLKTPISHNYTVQTSPVAKKSEQSQRQDCNNKTSLHRADTVINSNNKIIPINLTSIMNAKERLNTMSLTARPSLNNFYNPFKNEAQTFQQKDKQKALSSDYNAVTTRTLDEAKKLSQYKIFSTDKNKLVEQAANANREQNSNNEKKSSLPYSHSSTLKSKADVYHDVLHPRTLTTTTIEPSAGNKSIVENISFNKEKMGDSHNKAKNELTESIFSEFTNKYLTKPSENKVRSLNFKTLIDRYSLNSARYHVPK